MRDLNFKKKQLEKYLQQLQKFSPYIFEKNLIRFPGKLFDCVLETEYNKKYDEYIVLLNLVYNKFDINKKNTLLLAVMGQQSIQIKEDSEKDVFLLKEYLEKYLQIKKHTDFLDLFKKKEFYCNYPTSVNNMFNTPSPTEVMKPEEVIFQEYVANKDWSELDEECKQHWSTKE